MRTEVAIIVTVLLAVIAINTGFFKIEGRLMMNSIFFLIIALICGMMFLGRKE